MSLPWHRVIVRRLVFVVCFIRRGGGDACSGCIGIRRLSLECIGGLAVRSSCSTGCYSFLPSRGGRVSVDVNSSSLYVSK
jgi:hypothetical protein